MSEAWIGNDAYGGEDDRQSRIRWAYPGFQRRRSYRGFKQALGFFALLVLMKVGISGGRNLCEVEVPLPAGEF